MVLVTVRSSYHTGIFPSAQGVVGFPLAQLVKNLPAIQETQVQSQGREDSPGEGNGNRLQFSCLENPTYRGAWWATMCGVAKSQTQLSDQTTTTTQERWAEGAACGPESGSSDWFLAPIFFAGDLESFGLFLLVSGQHHSAPAEVGFVPCSSLLPATLPPCPGCWLVPPMQPGSQPCLGLEWAPSSPTSRPFCPLDGQWPGGYLDPTCLMTGGQ